MVISGREILKFVVFVLLVALVVFFVSANRQHLMGDTTGATPGGEAAAADGGDQGGDNPSEGSPSGQLDNVGAGAGAGPPGEDAGQGAGPVGGPETQPAGSGESAASAGDTGTPGNQTDPGATDDDQADLGAVIPVGVFGDDVLSALGLSDEVALGSGGSDLYVEFRLDRDQARSEQLDLLREILDNPNLSEEARAEATSQWLAITTQVGQEVEVENLLRAKGFADAVVILSQGKATVMIKASSLTPSEVLQVADVVVRLVGLAFEDVTVMARAG